MLQRRLFIATLAGPGRVPRVIATGNERDREVRTGVHTSEIEYDACLKSSRNKTELCAAPIIPFTEAIQFERVCVCVCLDV